MDITQALNDTRDAVAEATTVGRGAIDLLNRLADLVEANLTAPAELENIVAEIRSRSAELADAVTANTPPAEQPAAAHNAAPGPTADAVPDAEVTTQGEPVEVTDEAEATTEAAPTEAPGRPW